MRTPKSRSKCFLRQFNLIITNDKIIVILVYLIDYLHWISAVLSCHLKSLSTHSDVIFSKSVHYQSTAIEYNLTIKKIQQLEYYIYNRL